MKSAMQGPSAHLELLGGSTAFLLMKGLELVTGLCLTSLSNSPSMGRPRPEALARPQAMPLPILTTLAAQSQAPFLSVPSCVGRAKGRLWTRPLAVSWASHLSSPSQFPRNKDRSSNPVKTSQLIPLPLLTYNTRHSFPAPRQASDSCLVREV